jgi:hypothetical protein
MSPTMGSCSLSPSLHRPASPTSPIPSCGAGPLGGPSHRRASSRSRRTRLGSWSQEEEAFLTLDLAALPLVGGGTLNLLPQLDAEGFLDVVVTDATAADFMRLNIVVPEPTTGLLMATGLIGLAILGRRRS